MYKAPGVRDPDSSHDANSTSSEYASSGIPHVGGKIEEKNPKTRQRSSSLDRSSNKDESKKYKTKSDSNSNDSDNGNSRSNPRRPNEKSYPKFGPNSKLHSGPRSSSKSSRSSSYSRSRSCSCSGSSCSSHSGSSHSSKSDSNSSKSSIVSDSNIRRRRGRTRHRSSSSSNSSRSSSSSSNSSSNSRSRSSSNSRSSSGSRSHSSGGSLSGSRSRSDSIFCAKSEKSNKALESEKERLKDFIKMDIPSGGRIGGIYLPPARRALIQAEMPKIESNTEYAADEKIQKDSWELLRKKINSVVNKVSIYNIQNIYTEVLSVNIIRGRGLFCRSIMANQAASLLMTPVYACLVAIVNTKFPEIGELLLMRLIDLFRKSYRRRDKAGLLSSTKFIAHLCNQLVCGLVIPLQILLLLLNEPTDDSVEIASAFVIDIGALLLETAPKSLNEIFDRFRAILNQGNVDSRVEFLIHNLFAIYKSQFSAHPSIDEKLDLIEEESQIIHDQLSIDEDDESAPKINIHPELNYYKYDPDYEKHENEYKKIRMEIIGDDDDDDDDDDEEDDEEDANKSNEKNVNSGTIIDMSNEESTKLKRSVYLTIMSSRDFEEVVHKLLKAGVPPAHQYIVCNMFVQCCMEERIFLIFYANICQRFCLIEQRFQNTFEKIFLDTYSTIYRLESVQLRNVSQLFAHLFFNNSISWRNMECIKLNPRDTTASHRIFLKIFFQKLSELMGIEKLKAKLEKPELQASLTGLFPKNNPSDVKWAVNFWTAIELGALTQELRKIYEEMIQQIRSERNVQSEKLRRSRSSSSDGSGSSSYSRSGSSSSCSSSSRSSSSCSSRSRSSSSRSSRSRSRSTDSTSGSRSYSHSRSRSPARNNRRSRSPARNNRRSRSPARNNRRSRSPARNNRRSRSPARNYQRSPARNYQRSRSPARNYQRSPARNYQRSPARNYQRSRSPARNYQRSRSPARNYQRSRSPARNRSRSRSPHSRATSRPKPSSYSSREHKDS